MSRAYKCDICGEFYTADQKMSNKINDKHVRLGDDSSYSDLCPDCISAIQKVIDDRSNKNNG